MVLTVAVPGDALLSCYTFPREGRCGWARLLSALSYRLWMTDYGAVLPDRCCPAHRSALGGGPFPRVRIHQV
jgi:hypothetical protein